MKTLNNNVSRRRFLQFGAYGLVAVPVIGALGWATAAQAADKVDESSDTAQALGYRHDASTVDHPAYVEGNKCANCLLYTDTGGDWGPCAVFPGQQVAAKGWCTAWVARS